MNEEHGTDEWSFARPNVEEEHGVTAVCDLGSSRD